MTVLVKDLLELIDGELITGKPDFMIKSLARHPDLATGIDDLALVFTDKPTKALKTIKQSKASYFLIPSKLAEHEEFQAYLKEAESKANFIKSVRPRYSMQQFIKQFSIRHADKKHTVSSQAAIADSAKLTDNVNIGHFSIIEENVSIGENTFIGAQVFIGDNVSIGKNCIIYSGVKIYDNCKIADDVIIHSGAVIGADGYSFVTEIPSNTEKLQQRDFSFNFGRQTQHKIESIGTVIVEECVEIGANTCIDRGTIGDTLIGAGTKIDNLCQIAHNVQIGKDCLIVACVAIGGSTKLADRVLMAGASAAADNIEIANDVVVAGFSGVNSSCDPFLPVIGVPAIAYGEYMSRTRSVIRLPRLQKEFKELKASVKSHLKAQSAVQTEASQHGSDHTPSSIDLQANNTVVSNTAAIDDQTASNTEVSPS